MTWSYQKKNDDPRLEITEKISQEKAPEPL